MVALKIDMPKNCHDCPCAYWTEGCHHDYCQAAGYNTELIPELETRPDWCPLVPVPEHGRLIDADAAVANRNADMNWCYDLHDLPDYLSDCPTIIPASEEGE